MSPNGDARLAARLSGGLGSGVTDLHDVLPIEAQLADRVVDIGKREVRRLLLESGRDLRCPELSHDLEARDVEIAVVEERGELRHVAYQEAPVLAYAITAHRGGAVVDVTTQEREGELLGLLLDHRAVAHALDEAGLVVLPRVPLVHAFEHVVRLMDRAYRALV